MGAGYQQLRTFGRFESASGGLHAQHAPERREQESGGGRHEGIFWYDFVFYRDFY